MVALLLGGCDDRLLGEGEVGGVEGGSAAGLTHASCTTPMPNPPPPLPHVTYQGDTPEFALWQSLPCDEPAVVGVVTCDEDPECPEANCVDFGGSPGVCSYGDIDSWCDGEGYATGSSDGSCWTCIEPFQHARACCDFPDSIFDCRQWPFDDAPGTIGQVCATHEDCEPGLACSEPYWAYESVDVGGGCHDTEQCEEGTCEDGLCVVEMPHYAGYGICACPGTDHTEVVPSGSCQ